MQTGHIFVVSAPSGCGKTTLVQTLLAQRPELTLSTSHTTRAPRSNETDGQSYHFVSPNIFQNMVDTGAFVEHAHVFGNRYGTSHDAIQGALDAGQNVLLEIDVQGAKQIAERFADQATLCFILPPSAQTLRERLTARQEDSSNEIEKRLRMVGQEVQDIAHFGYIIINDDLAIATDELSAVVTAAKRAKSIQLKKYAKLVEELGKMR